MKGERGSAIIAACQRTFVALALAGAALGAQGQHVPPRQQQEAADDSLLRELESVVILPSGADQEQGNKPLAPLEAEFIKLVLSRQGQEVVMKDGYIPLPSKVVAKALADLGLQEGAVAAK